MLFAMGWIAVVALVRLCLGFPLPSGHVTPTNVFLPSLEVLLSSEAAAPCVSAIC